jgi:hypothetical protein
MHEGNINSQQDRAGELFPFSVAQLDRKWGQCG